MKKYLLLAITSLVGMTAVSAQAAEVLNFAGLDGTNQESVNNFYNGGTGSDGSGPGPNYGISFTSNAIACTSIACNVAEIPGGPSANIIFFLTGAAATMNVAAGFTTGFSFDYSAVNSPGFVNVFSGLNDTGTLLATIMLPLTPDSGDAGCGGKDYCPYTPIGVTFTGTAESVDFGGTEDQVAFADVTLGSPTAGGGSVLPEPSTWALMLTGFGMVGYCLRRRSAVRLTYA